MKSLLVPVDESEYSKRALRKAYEIAKAFNSKVTLVHVISFYPAIDPYTAQVFESTISKSVKQHADNIIKDSKGYFKGMEDKVETFILEGDPAHTIADFANNKDFDLVIMGSHGMNPLQRLLLGSITNKVLHHIKKSILIVR